MSGLLQHTLQMLPSPRLSLLPVTPPVPPASPTEMLFFLSLTSPFPSSDPRLTCPFL